VWRRYSRIHVDAALFTLTAFTCRSLQPLGASTVTRHCLLGPCRLGRSSGVGIQPQQLQQQERSRRTRKTCPTSPCQTLCCRRRVAAPLHRHLVPHSTVRGRCRRRAHRRKNKHLEPAQRLQQRRCLRLVLRATPSPSTLPTAAATTTLLLARQRRRSRRSVKTKASVMRAETTQVALLGMLLVRPTPQPPSRR